MCGIVGIIGAPRTAELQDMLNVITHRGEDCQKHRAFDQFGSMGINRLSIIDLERGDQPWFNEDGSLALVCNGEIYNHESIRHDLAENHEYRTGSDAEVILHLYEEYGDDAIKFLDGMFAFILFDLRKRRTFEEMLEMLPEAIYHIESYNPSMVTGAIVTLMASRLAAERGVKVVLCGEGSDELFGGYSAVRSFSFLELRENSTRC